MTSAEPSVSWKLPPINESTPAARGGLRDPFSKVKRDVCIGRGETSVDKVAQYLAHVETKYKYDEETGECMTLPPEDGLIHVVRAEGLKQADVYDGSDPYAVVFWNDKEIGKTKVIEDSFNPEFNEKFAVTVAQGVVNVLRVEVYDYDDSELDDDPWVSPVSIHLCV